MSGGFERFQMKMKSSKTQWSFHIRVPILLFWITMKNGCRQSHPNLLQKQEESLWAFGLVYDAQAYAEIFLYSLISSSFA